MTEDTKPRGFHRAVGLMMAITLLGKLLGILRDRMQSVHFGADTPESVAFMGASFLPRNFFDIMFASVFSASLIPVFSAYLEKQGKKAAYDLAALFITVTFALTTAFTVICVIFTPFIYDAALGGGALNPGTRALGIELLRIMFPLMILSGLAFSMTGILQSLGEFNLPAAASVASNIVILIYYAFFIERFGVYGLCAAFLLGWAAQALIQLPFLIKQKFPFRPRFNLKDPGLREIFGLSLPAMAASWVGPVNLLVNARASVGLYGGRYGFVGIHFGYNLFAIISGVFVLSVANYMFPEFSRQSAAGDDGGFADALRVTSRGLLFILLPMTLGLMAVSEPLVRLVYEGGLFRDGAVGVTATALFYFAPGIVGYGFQVILSRACFALRDGKTPLVAAAAAVVLNAALSFALAPAMEVAGPALASSVSVTVAAGYMFIVLARRGHIKWNAGMTADTLKMAAAAVIMLAVTLCCRMWLDARLGVRFLSRALAAGAPAALGAAVYFGCCMLFGVEEIKRVTDMFKKRAGRA